MRLNPDEQRLLDGEQGLTLQKVMRTLVLYGEALGAERFAAIEGGGHFALHHVLPGIGPRPEMLDELVEAGLKAKFPFTLDPHPPLDFENLDLLPIQANKFRKMFQGQSHFDACMQQVGRRDPDAYTCTPYLPEVGNIPKRGAILAWSESSAVVFANSVLGARTNRNAVILDLLSNLVGKTPLTGLLTDAGRRASWHVEVNTTALPNPQLLGAAIGKKVVEDVPYITGLDRFLGAGLKDETRDYLKEMGAACAAIGAVGLYHVENITPEAVEGQRYWLESDCQTYVVDNRELQDQLAAYPVMWADPSAKPERCFIGCPHLSLPELYAWTQSIHGALQAHGRHQVAVPTVIAAAPQVLRQFKADAAAYEQLRSTGVMLSATCLEACMDNPYLAAEAVATNSNKLRAFTTARLFLNAELLEIMTYGELPGRQRHE
jgi:predicted aconitase